MTEMKLFHRSEVAAASGEYLIVISELDGCEWVPDRVRIAQTLPELKDAIRQTIADAGFVVVRGSRRFDQLAFELGLRLFNSEWGNV